MVPLPLYSWGRIMFYSYHVLYVHTKDDDYDKIINKRITFATCFTSIMWHILNRVHNDFLLTLYSNNAGLLCKIIEVLTYKFEACKWTPVTHAPRRVTLCFLLASQGVIVLLNCLPAKRKVLVIILCQTHPTYECKMSAVTSFCSLSALHEMM